MSALGLAVRLRALRERKEISQDDLSKELKLSRGWISLLERGSTENPGGPRLGRLAEYFGVTERYLLYGDEEGESDPFKMAALKRMESWPVDAILAAEQAGLIWMKYLRGEEPRRVVEPDADADEERYVPQGKGRPPKS